MIRLVGNCEANLVLPLQCIDLKILWWWVLPNRYKQLSVWRHCWIFLWHWSREWRPWQTTVVMVMYEFGYGGLFWCLYGYGRFHTCSSCCWSKLPNELPMQDQRSQERKLQTNILCCMRVFCTYIVWCQITHLHGRWSNLWYICLNVRAFSDMIVQMSEH